MTQRLTIGIVGCGRMGQHYAEVYATLPDTEIVAIAEVNPERRRAVGERFGVHALFVDVDDLLRHVTPDLVAVVLPGRYIKHAVVASAQAGVRGVSADKPIEACLADADEMVDTCRERGVVFAGGNLQRAMSQVQEAAARLRAGDFGIVRGATVHGWGGEISGGGCQHIAVLRLFTGAEITRIVAWGTPEEALRSERDTGLVVHAQAQLDNGLPVSIFGTPTPGRGVDVWTDDALVRWDWAPPEVYQGFDAGGARQRLEPTYRPLRYPRFSYLGTSILSFVDVVRHGGDLFVSGHDLRQSLEVAIAAKFSALGGSVPLTLPLADRSLRLLPGEYRWSGGDATGKVQSPQQVLHDDLFPEAE